MSVTVGSLFSGIGGLELGLEMCGLGPVLWQCDSDPYARAVLEAHWPTVRRYNDVREIDATSAARVDVLCGGFPCQPHSLAGKRRGESDVRWLWPQFARIIGDLRPQVVFMENVPGLRTSGLRRVLADLADFGFNAEWDYYSAAEVGAPHRRIRLFILAYADREHGWLQSGRGSWEDWTNSALVANDGAHGDVAHAASDGREPRRTGDATERTRGRELGRGGLGEDLPEMPVSEEMRLSGRAEWAGEQRVSGSQHGSARVAGLPRARESVSCTSATSELLADSNGEGLAQRQEQPPRDELTPTERGSSRADSWATEPAMGRVAHGVPHRTHRLRLLGNAVVPAQAALAFRSLIARCGTP